MLHIDYSEFINYFCPKITIAMKQRVFKRKIYDNILDWKRKNNGRTALLVEGARRIGKSTIVEEFARNEYKS